MQAFAHAVPSARPALSSSAPSLALLIPCQLGGHFLTPRPNSGRACSQPFTQLLSTRPALEASLGAGAAAGVDRLSPCPWAGGVPMVNKRSQGQQCVLCQISMPAGSKTNQGRGQGESWQRPPRSEGGNHGESGPCKGPEAGACRGCGRSRKEPGRSGQTEGVQVSQRGGRDRGGGGGGRGPTEPALGQQPPSLQGPPQAPPNLEPPEQSLHAACPSPTQLLPLSWKHFPVGLWGAGGHCWGSVSTGGASRHSSSELPAGEASVSLVPVRQSGAGCLPAQVVSFW